MTRLLPIILLSLALAGCGHITTYYRDGTKEAEEWTLLKDVSLGKFTGDGQGAKTIEGGAAKVNVEATRVAVTSAVEGITRGVIGMFKP